MHSLSIIPQFRAISGDSYLFKKQTNKQPQSEILYKYFHKLALHLHAANNDRFQCYQVNKNSAS